MLDHKQRTFDIEVTGTWYKFFNQVTHLLTHPLLPAAALAILNCRIFSSISLK